MDYANQFFNYRSASVWSAPESLKSLKRLPEMTPELDVYSFGLIVWELFHEHVPFDDDLIEAQKYVINEESRPKIICKPEDIDEETYDEDDEELAIKK